MRGLGGNREAYARGDCTHFGGGVKVWWVGTLVWFSIEVFAFEVNGVDML